jgi:hypothetical protein
MHLHRKLVLGDPILVNPRVELWVDHLMGVGLYPIVSPLDFGRQNQKVR